MVSEDQLKKSNLVHTMHSNVVSYKGNMHPDTSWSENRILDVLNQNVHWQHTDVITKLQMFLIIHDAVLAFVVN